jgi:hypothetical protein
MRVGELKGGPKLAAKSASQSADTRVAARHPAKTHGAAQPDAVA